MNKLMMLTCASAMAGCLFAESNASTAPSPKEVAANPIVEEMLLDDDGVSIVTAPDGSFQIFTRGSGTYKFVDPQVELDARKVARLNAEKNLSAFISTKVAGEDGVENIEKNSCTMTGDGTIQQEQNSKESLGDIRTKIITSTQGILNGLTVVESKKIPTPGTTKGVIQVTMVYSSKTSRASTWMGKQLQNHQTELKINEAKNEARVNAVRVEANAAGTQKVAADASAAVGAEAKSVGATATAPKWSATDANKPERRVNKTEY